MANQPFRNNRFQQAGNMGRTLPDVTPNGVNIGSGVSGGPVGLSAKLGSALGYKKGGHKGAGLPLPTPSLHGMGGHNPGVSDGMADPKGIARIGTQGMGSSSGSKGPSLPRAGVPRHKGGMVASPKGITKGSDSPPPRSFRSKR